MYPISAIQSEMFPHSSNNKQTRQKKLMGSIRGRCICIINTNTHPTTPTRN